MARLSDENARINECLQGVESMVSAVELLGYELKKEGGYYKFARRDEKTPSCVVNNDATWHDFGSGEHGDWAALYMERTGCSFRDAVKEGMRRFGIAETQDGYTPSRLPALKRPAKPKKETKPIGVGLLGWFAKEAAAHPARYMELCRRLMPFARPAEIHKAQRVFRIGYDSKEDRLTIPVFNLEGEIVNLFKYTPYAPVEKWQYHITLGRVRFVPACPAGCVRPFNEALRTRLKVRYIKGRERTLFNLDVLHHCPKAVYIVEGEKDAINAAVAKKAAVTQGGANMWKPHFAQDLLAACRRYYGDSGLPRIVIIQDHDQAGLDSTVKVYESLCAVFPEVTMAFWKTRTAEWVRERITSHRPLLQKDPETVRKQWKTRSTDWLLKATDHSVAVVNPKLEGYVAPKFDFTDYEQLKRRL